MVNWACFMILTSCLFVCCFFLFFFFCFFFSFGFYIRFARLLFVVLFFFFLGGIVKLIMFHYCSFNGTQSVNHCVILFF